MGAHPTQVTERDGRILAFVAEHRIVLAAHVQALLGVSETVAYRRLRGSVRSVCSTTPACSMGSRAGIRSPVVDWR